MTEKRKKSDSSRGSVIELVRALPEQESAVAVLPRPRQSTYDAAPALPGRLDGQSLRHVMESYVRYYAAGDGHTARAKRYDLRHFLEFLAQHSGAGSSTDLVKVSDWTMQATKDFVDSRLSLGEAPATVNRRLATVKHFGRTLGERVHGFINPAREVKNPVLAQCRPHGLSEEETALLREAARSETDVDRPSFAIQRNRFLLELLLATGLRADEVRLLTDGQVTDDFTWLKNVKTKGQKFRNVYLEEGIRRQSEEYFELRLEEITKKFPGFAGLEKKEQKKFPVLISTYGAQLSTPSSFGLSPKTIWRIVAGYGAKARALSKGSIGNLHPHKLRHTFAHGLLDSSKDVRLVAQALGHSDVRTTMRYTERSDEEIAQAIEDKAKSN